jgi:hypothetical protein
MGAATANQGRNKSITAEKIMERKSSQESQRSIPEDP